MASKGVACMASKMLVWLQSIASMVAARITLDGLTTCVVVMIVQEVVAKQGVGKISYVKENTRRRI